MTGLRPWVCLAFLPVIFLGVVQSGGVRPGGEAGLSPEGLFWEADFAAAAGRIEKTDEKTRTLDDKLLWVECLARSGRGVLAEKKMHEVLPAPLRSAPPEPVDGSEGNSRLLAVAGVVLFSLGRIDEAEKYIGSALSSEPVSDRAVLAGVTLSLHLRKSGQALLLYERLLQMRRPEPGSLLLYLLGLEVYNAGQDPKKIAALYESQSERWKVRNRTYSAGLRANARLYRQAAGGRMFRASGESEETIVPFAPAPADRHANVIQVEIKGARFRVLLDTGNRVGWTVHNPELLVLLRSRRGGRALSTIGTQVGYLEGVSIYTPKLEFAGFTLQGLAGLYTPKPHPDFYDANLNPAFIRDRVTTLDYSGKRLILRSEHKFQGDMRTTPGRETAELPWRGLGHVFVPVEAGGREGLGLIETGAEDISLNLAFAQGAGLSLKPAKRYLASGEVVSYFETPLRLLLGPFAFERTSAEVWPFHRLSDPISGLTPDVVIGPAALAVGFAISFDAFGGRVFLEKPAQRPI